MKLLNLCAIIIPILFCKSCSYNKEISKSEIASSAEFGSSKIMTSAFLEKVLAMESFCHSPIDICFPSSNQYPS
jgi:hypothetical protein